ncbi:hypothetical protein [Anabaena sp. CCY 9910]|uniref:hypothetical protein n=1 Tax=Anabaena sp. CCY 9910 TaxID=3103870 RepID=UPI0039E086D5
MKNINVQFDMPDWVQQGLANNQYERFGGVIRENASGKIVVYLRETNSFINQSLSNLSNIGSIASILNLGVSVIGFALILNKLNDLDNRLLVIENSLKDIQSKLGDINYKIDLTFKSELIGALKQLIKAISLSDNCLKQRLIINIVYIFEKTTAIFKDITEKNSQSAIFSYETFCSAYQAYFLFYLSSTSLSICYLEVNELMTAEKILKECIYSSKEIYQEMLLLDYDIDEEDQEEAEEKAIEEFLDSIRDSEWESSIIFPTSLAEYISGGFRLKEDSENIEKRCQEQYTHTKQMLKDFKNLLLNLKSFSEEIQYIQKADISWSEWKSLKPTNNFSESEYIYVIPCAASLK